MTADSRGVVAETVSSEASAPALGAHSTRAATVTAPMSSQLRPQGTDPRPDGPVEHRGDEQVEHGLDRDPASGCRWPARHPVAGAGDDDHRRVTDDEPSPDLPVARVAQGPKMPPQVSRVRIRHRLHHRSRDRRSLCELRGRSAVVRTAPGSHTPMIAISLPRPSKSAGFRV